MNLGYNPFKLRKLVRDLATKYSRQIGLIVQLKSERAEQEIRIMELEKQIRQLQTALNTARNQIAIVEYFQSTTETRKQRRNKTS